MAPSQITLTTLATPIRIGEVFIIRTVHENGSCTATLTHAGRETPIPRIPVDEDISYRRLGFHKWPTPKNHRRHLRNR